MAENLTTLQVTSLTLDGTDLTSMGILVQQDLFITNDDGRVALTGITSVTVSEEKLVVVFDRALDTDSTGNRLARIPTTCHAEITPLPAPQKGVIIACIGTCPEDTTCKFVAEATRAGADADATRAGGTVTFFCDCI